MPRSRRLPTPEGPAEQGVLGDVHYTLWRPRSEPWGGMVVIHGAQSCKENHHDMARAARDAGMTAVAFDLRGHGATGGRLDGRAIEDVVAMAGLVGTPLVLRGSSLGGFLAIAAAEAAGADAIIAVCPASAQGLATGLRSGRLPVPVDIDAAETLLQRHDLGGIVERSTIPLMLLHAENDESVPVAHSRELHARSAAPDTRLIVVPGGHHRSVQHDPDLQLESLRWARKAVSPSL